MKISENNVLRRIFGPKRDEMIGGWRKLQNEELDNVHALLNTSIIRTIKSSRARWAETCSTREGAEECMVLMG
jgi:hypothetical protein